MKFIEKTMETWSGIDSRRKKLNRDTEKHIPGRYTIAIAIYNSDDATQSHSQEMNWW